MSAATIGFPERRRFNMSRSVFFVGCAFAVILLALLAIPHHTPSKIALAMAPGFTLNDVNGGHPISLSQRDGKPAVVNFFASWCIPCRTEMPRLAEQAKAHPGVAFFGVDHRDSRIEARNLMTASGVGYPSAYDPDGTVASDYGLTTGLPTTVFIDRNGQIVHTQFGEISDSELQTQLSHLVGEK